MDGYIYILSNPSFTEGLLKIGKSSRDPATGRKRELYTTGVPGEFVLEYSARVQCHSVMETQIHNALADFRYSKNREFFAYKLDSVIHIVRQVLGSRLISEDLSPNASMLVMNQGVIVESKHSNGKRKIVRSFKRGGKLYIEEHYFSNGRLKLQKHFINDVLNGLYKEKDKSGYVKSRGMMLAGKRQGEWYFRKVSKTGCSKVLITEWSKYFDKDQPVLCWIKREGNDEDKRGYPDPKIGYEQRNEEAKFKQKAFEC